MAAHFKLIRLRRGQEDARTREMYSTGKFTVPKSVLKKKRNTTASFSPVALGDQMLMARRLCEAGSLFVTVSSAAELNAAAPAPTRPKKLLLRNKPFAWCMTISRG